MTLKKGCMIFMRLSNVSLADYCFFIYFVLLIKKNVEMKKIFKLVLFFGVMAFGLSACSDDDDDKLSGIIDSIDVQMGEYTATQKFTYDQEGRVIKITEPAFGENGVGEVSYSFTYADNKVTVVFAEGTDDKDAETYEFKLEEGKAVSFTEGTREGKLVYDGNKLQKWVGDGESINIVWKDGNIVSVAYAEDEVENFKVFPYENKANIDYFSTFSDVMISGAVYAGIIGEKTKNVVLPEGPDYKITTKDGYITEISFVEEEEGEVYTTTVKFNYK